MKRTVLVFILLGTSTGSVPAQTVNSPAPSTSAQSVPPVKNPVTTVLRTMLPSREKKILRSDRCDARR